MLIGDLTDTLMNIVTFAFLGVMVWLLVRPPPDRNGPSPGAKDDKS